MLQFNKYARRVAAVDEKLLEECPVADKIWANQIGYALSLTFIVLFGIIFYSLTYIDGAQIVFDAQSNSVKFDSHPYSLIDYLKYVVIALIIALVIFLFDRAFYQSDWFLHAPYGEELTAWQKSKNIISKFFRILVRLSISLSLAYALSIFLELKFYESELLSAMQKKHLNENKDHYDAILDYAKELNKEEAELKDEEVELLNKIQNMRKGLFSWSDDEFLRSMKDEKISYEQKAKKNMSILDKSYEHKISKLNSEKKRLEEQIVTLKDEYNLMDLSYQAEVSGVKKIKLGDRTIEATGIPKEGSMAHMYKTRKEQIYKKITPIQRKLDEVDVQIKNIKQKYNDQIQKIGSILREKMNRFDKQTEIYKQKVKENYNKDAESIKKELNDRLYEVQKRLDDLLKNKEKYINKRYIDVMQSPEFIPFRDGMMSRLIAFKDLSSDPTYGKEIAIFSWIVKGLMIFLEVIPVLSKMLFSPPTVYATKLQMRTRRVTESYIENNGATLKEIQEQIDIENKKRELMEAKWQTRLKSSFKKIDDVELDNIIMQSVKTYASKNIA